ncbi:MAG: 2OG-Fe(II) oxygenase [Pseudomonadota bacterium]
MPDPIEALVDLDQFPLHAPGSAAYQALVSAAREDWRTRGAFRLPQLLRTEVARNAAAELEPRFACHAFRHRRSHNIYFDDDMADLPADLLDHRLVTSHRTLTCDQLNGTIIRSVYEWDPLCEFLRRVLDLPELFRVADPMARLNVMAYADGDELGWHFDRAEFAVTLLLKGADTGGHFEYRRNLRTLSDPNVEGVRRLLVGADPEVRQARSSPGTMTVFSGSCSAHRVSRVTGTSARIMAVLSFMEQPDHHYAPADRLRFYGRSSPDEALTD